MELEEKRTQIMKHYGTEIMCEDSAGVNLYYRCMVKGMSLLDADEYAALNTLLGYDIGMKNAEIINDNLWKHGIEPLELDGNDISKKYVEKAAEEVRIAVDFSNWRTKPLVVYEYFDECDLKTSNPFSAQVN